MNVNSHFFILALLVTSFFLTACTREEKDKDHSTVVFSVPGRGELQKGLNSTQGVSLPTDKRICYGINVSAPDISAGSATSCHKSFSTAAGFVSEGESLSISIPKGAGRNFELFVYLTDLGSTCPAWDGNFEQTPGRYLNMYRAGETANVTLSKDSESVSIALNFPGVGSHLAATEGDVTQCLASGTAKLRGLLYTTGEIIDVPTAPDTPSILSKAYWDSFFEIILGNPYSATSIGTANSTGGLHIGSGFATSAYIKSVTRKPDETNLYGLDEAGQIYLVDSTTGVVSSSFTCPFDRCLIPPWVQSISAGYGTQLFALDHAGTIYLVTSTDLIPVGVSVSAAVKQISYY